MNPSSSTNVEVLFNSGVLAHAIAAADELRILDDLANDETCDFVRMRGDEGFRQPFVALMVVLERGAVVSQVPGGSRWTRGRNFAPIYAAKGFFSWLFSASGAVFVDAAAIIDSSEEKGLPNRNAALIARAAADFGRYELDPLLRQLPELTSAACIADFGCGNASRLLQLVTHIGCSAVGIDISPQATAIARETVAVAGCSNQIAVLTADVTNLYGCRDSLQGAEAILMCLMAHDLWPRERCIQTFSNWKEWLPNAKHLVICETVRETPSASELPPIPVLGYEYLHGLMNQPIPSRQEWYEVLNAAGWKLERRHEITIPGQTIVLVCSRAP